MEKESHKTQAFSVDKIEAKEVLGEPKEKCEGCKRAENVKGEYIYTCNCNVETKTN